MKRSPAYSVLAGILVFYLLGNFIWLKKQNAEYIVEPCHGGYFQETMNVYDVIKNFDAEGLKSYIKYGEYAPLNLIFSAIILLVTGKSYIALILILNLLYFGIALFFTYELGKLILNEQAGLLSALFMAMFPAVYGLSRMYCLDFALIPAVVFSVYSLFKTDYFTSRKRSVIFGISVGIGMLIRYSFGAFILGPCVCIILASLRGRRDKKVLINVGIALTAGLILSGYRYFNARTLIRVIADPFSENLRGPWYTFANLRIYTLGIFERQLSIPFFLLFIAGIIKFFSGKLHKDIKLAFLFWLAIPWLILVFMPHFKRTPFIIPYLPAIAVISAAGLENIKRKTKSFLLSVIFIAALIQYFDFSFGTGPGLYKLKIKLGEEKEISYYLVGGENEEVIYFKSRRKEAMDKIKQILNARGRNFKLLLLPSGSHNLDYCSFRTMLWFSDLNIRLIDNATIQSILQNPEEMFSDGIDAILNSSSYDLRSEEYIDFLMGHFAETAGVYPHQEQMLLEKINKIDWPEFKNRLRGLISRFPAVEQIEKKDQGEIAIYFKK